MIASYDGFSKLQTLCLPAASLPTVGSTHWHCDLARSVRLRDSYYHSCNILWYWLSDVMIFTWNNHDMIVLIRGISRGISQVSRNQSDLLNWHDISIDSNKKSRFMDNILIKQSWHCWSHLFILIYVCLPEVILGQGQSCPKSRFRKSWDIC